MKTKLNYSKYQGRLDDKKFHSVAEFCRLVANDTVLDVYGYFSNFYASFIADTMKTQKHESENANEYRQRVLRNAFNQVKSTPTKVLKETELYKIFASKNQLFKLIRTISPCFYDLDGNHKFAKRTIVAFNTSKITKERTNDMINSGYKVVTLDIPKTANFPNGKKVEIITKHFKTENGVFDKDLTLGEFYNRLDKVRKQRKDKFSELKETPEYFFDDNDNVVTLTENDKMNFVTLYAYISEYAQIENFKKVATIQENEKRQKSLLNLWNATKKLDTKVSIAFNKVLDYRTKVQSEYKNAYIQDDCKREVVLGMFTKLLAEYKAECKKRFADWNESENAFISDTSKVVRVLCIDKPKKQTRSTRSNSTRSNSTRSNSTQNK